MQRTLRSYVMNSVGPSIMTMLAAEKLWRSEALFADPNHLYGANNGDDRDIDVASGWNRCAYVPLDSVAFDALAML